MPIAPDPSAANNPQQGGWGGGYTYPSIGANGFLQTPTGIPYYQGITSVANIPDFQRRYSFRDELVFLVREGRNNMMKVLLEYARRGGNNPLRTDVQFRFRKEFAGTGRFYLKTMTNALEAATAGEAVHVQLKDAKDAKRIQKDDILASMGTFVNPTRSTQPQNAKSTTYPLPELLKVIEVNYSTGQLTVERNFAATLSRTNPGATAIEVSATAGAGKILEADAFLIRMGNSIAEGNDDQKVYSKSGTWDYNFMQQVLRKWGWNDIESNITKAGQGETTQFKNKRETLDDFWDELEWLGLFGTRGEGTDENGKWKGYSGGFFEHVPGNNYHSIKAPVYNTGTNTAVTMGDFEVPKFNKLFADKFYYGSQSKVLLCGERFHTAFAVMLNNMTTAIPAMITEWAVRGHVFDPSNGGRVTVMPSDKMSLNGMTDYAILLDPETFKYVHLQNRDINVIEKLVNTNPHEDTGEINGVIGFERSNPDANHVFIME
jgi:hypothetical protein